MLFNIFFVCECNFFLNKFLTKKNLYVQFQIPLQSSPFPIWSILSNSSGLRSPGGVAIRAAEEEDGEELSCANCTVLGIRPTAAGGEGEEASQIK